MKGRRFQVHRLHQGTQRLADAGIVVDDEDSRFVVQVFALQRGFSGQGSGAGF